MTEDDPFSIRFYMDALEPIMRRERRIQAARLGAWSALVFISGWAFAEAWPW